jgi:UPF0271 protein
MKIDINCDMGESFGRYSLGNDAQLITRITSASIACGLHAGDPMVMEHTVRLAYENDVSIGAHPAYPDLQGFGRRVMDLTPEEIEAFVLYQVGALAAFTKSAGVNLAHVKVHGALYNYASTQLPAAQAIARGVRRFSGELILVGLAGSLMIQAAVDSGLRFASEGFPERAYNPDGSLMSRRLPGAVLDSPEDAANQAIKLVNEGIKVTSGSQNETYRVDTLCIHGDSPNAIAVSEAIYNALKAQHVELVSLPELVA